MKLYVDQHIFASILVALGGYLKHHVVHEFHSPKMQIQKWITQI